MVVTNHNKKYLIILGILLSLSIGFIVYLNHLNNSLIKAQDELEKKYIQDKVDNYRDSVVVSNIYKTVLQYDTLYTEKLLIIKKNAEDEKEYIESINDNTLLRKLGKRAIKRYNMHQTK